MSLKVLYEEIKNSNSIELGKFPINNVYNLEGGFLAWSENGYEVNR